MVTWVVTEKLNTTGVHVHCPKASDAELKPAALWFSLALNWLINATDWQDSTCT
jgi:hypothetical protein